MPALAFGPPRCQRFPHTPGPPCHVLATQVPLPQRHYARPVGCSRRVLGQARPRAHAGVDAAGWVPRARCGARGDVVGDDFGDVDQVHGLPAALYSRRHCQQRRGCLCCCRWRRRCCRGSPLLVAGPDRGSDPRRRAPPHSPQQADPGGRAPPQDSGGVVRGLLHLQPESHQLLRNALPRAVGASNRGQSGLAVPSFHLPLPRSFCPTPLNPCRTPPSPSSLSASERAPHGRLGVARLQRGAHGAAGRRPGRSQAGHVRHGRAPRDRPRCRRA